MKIYEALRLNQDARIAWVGAGGKTTSMFRAARQFGGKILVSATAHLATEQIRLADRHFVVQKLTELDRIHEQLVNGINLITGTESPAGRVQGLDAQTIQGVNDLADRTGIPLLIEADGARQRSIKAPAAHEPPIPPWVSSVVVLAGLSAVGKSLDDQAVFRPELFAELSGATIGSEISLADVCKAMVHPQGGLKNIPKTAEKILLFNQADAARFSLDKIQDYKEGLLNSYQSVIVSSMQTENNEIRVRYENIAGVILAAGQSERFGMPKQLLDWKGKPFIRQIVEAALAGGLRPILVVLGAILEPIEDILKDLPVEIVVNPDWSHGLSSTIRAGVQKVENRSRAAIFLVSDMPQISGDLIRHYLDYHAKNDYYILAPRVKGQRTNPAMFDLRCYDALKALEGDSGGRQLFDRFRVNWLEVEDSTMAIDVDTHDDYTMLMKKLSAKNVK